MWLSTVRSIAATAGALGILSIVGATSVALSDPSAPPAWADPINPGGPPRPRPDDGSPKPVPNSSVALTQTQLFNRFSAPDWHPEAHPPMPASVAHGRAPDLLACAYCASSLAVNLGWRRRGLDLAPLRLG